VATSVYRARHPKTLRVLRGTLCGSRTLAIFRARTCAYECRLNIESAAHIPLGPNQVKHWYDHRPINARMTSTRETTWATRRYVPMGTVDLTTRTYVRSGAKPSATS